MDLQAIRLFSGRPTPVELFLEDYGLVFHFLFIFILNFFLISILLKLFKIETKFKKRLIYVFIYTIGGVLVGLLGMKLVGWHWWRRYEFLEPSASYFDFRLETRLGYYLLIKALTTFCLIVYSFILNLIFFKKVVKSKLVLLSLLTGLFTNPLWIATFNLGKYLRQFISYFYYKYIFLTR